MQKKTVTAVILAAGSGARMQSDKVKQNIEIFGESVLSHTVRAFEKSELTDGIVVVCREKDLSEYERSLKSFSKVRAVVAGGSSRRESAEKGVSAVPADSHLVAIHDGARCLITPEMIDKVVSAAIECGAATAGASVVDTVKITDGKSIVGTYPREKLFAATTPQVFLVDIYKKALQNSEKNDNITDDNMMVERLGVEIKCVDLGRENIKITTPEDLEYAEFVIGKRMKNV